MNEKTSPKVVAPRRRFSPWWWLAAVVVLLVVLPILAHFYSTSEYFAPELVISRETTYITEPLTPEGLPDYVACLNRRLSRGVTPENNAAVLLLQAAGRKIDDFLIPAEMFHALGMEVPPPGSMWRSVAQQEVALIRQGQLPQGYNKWHRCFSRPWRREDAPLVDRMLENNARSLELAYQASLRPRLFVPIIVAPGKPLGNRNKDIQSIVRVAVWDLRLRAMQHLGHGRVEDAWRDVLAIKRLGQLVVQLSSLALARQCEDSAATVVRALLSRTRLTEPAAARLLQQWRGHPPALNLAESFEQFARFALLDLALHLYHRPGSRAGRPGTSPAGVLHRGLDINYILRRINRRVDRSIALARRQSLPAIDRQCRQWSRQADTALQSRLRRLLALFNRTARSDLVAEEFFNPRTKSLYFLKLEEATAYQKHLMVETALALTVYRARHGHYPEKLDALVPELLPQVPPDLFAPGRQMGYRRQPNGFLLFALGGGFDQGGAGKEVPLKNAHFQFRITHTFPAEEPSESSSSAASREEKSRDE